MPRLRLIIVLLAGLPSRTLVSYTLVSYTLVSHTLGQSQLPLVALELAS